MNLPLIMVLGIFLIIGLIFLVGGIYLSTGFYQDCTMKVTGTCKKIKKRKHYDGHADNVFSPVFEIEWYGEKKRICGEIYTTGSTPKLGEERTLYVNPRDPNRFYDPKQIRVITVLLSIIGIGFILPPVILFLKAAIPG